MPPESALTSRIKKALEAAGAKVIKIHGTAFATVGTPDLVGCYRSRGFAIEVKRPGGKEGFWFYEPTAAQHLQLMSWGGAGARVGVARSVEDALRIVGVK